MKSTINVRVCIIVTPYGIAYAKLVHPEGFHDHITSRYVHTRMFLHAYDRVYTRTCMIMCMRICACN